MAIFILNIGNVFKYEKVNKAAENDEIKDLIVSRAYNTALYSINIAKKKKIVKHWIFSQKVLIPFKILYIFKRKYKSSIKVGAISQISEMDAKR